MSRHTNTTYKSSIRRTATTPRANQAYGTPRHTCPDDHSMMHVALATEMDNQVHLLLVEKTYSLAFKDIMKRPFLFGSTPRGQENLQRVLCLCYKQELETISRISTGQQMEKLARKFLESLEEKKDARDDPANSSTSRATSEDWDQLAREAPFQAQSLLQSGDYKDCLQYLFPRAFVKSTEDPTSSDNAMRAINRFLKPGQQHKVKFFESKQQTVHVKCNQGGYYPEQNKMSVFHFAFVPRDALILANPDNVTKLKTFSVSACITSNEVSREAQTFASQEQVFLAQCAKPNTQQAVTPSTSTLDSPVALFSGLRIGHDDFVD